MKRLKQGVIMVFSIVAVLTYLSSLHVPAITVANLHAGNLMLFLVNENQNILMYPVSVVCVDVKDCILKSYSLLIKEGVLPSATVIEDLYLDGGDLVLRMNSGFLSLVEKKKQEAFLWYLLQFKEVEDIQIYVDEVKWEIPMVYDAKKVYSSSFLSYSHDLYFSMPIVLFRNVDGLQQIETIRIPYTEDHKRLVEWFLYIYEESGLTTVLCEMDEGVLVVELKGSVKNRWVFESLAHSLWVLDAVEEVCIFHEGILVKKTG